MSVSSTARNRMQTAHMNNVFVREKDRHRERDVVVSAKRRRRAPIRFAIALRIYNIGRSFSCLVSLAVLFT